MEMLAAGGGVLCGAVVVGGPARREADMASDAVAMEKTVEDMVDPFEGKAIVRTVIMRRKS
ncbi:hypothetical protein [Austwickia chelonae]|uniref:hypothetical protein n=1 Tax=Austwickia chelonae TaxID=100225 RepID=UPI001F07324D|nr:hypothetical protein [Austwickia chelonae]